MNWKSLPVLLSGLALASVAPLSHAAVYSQSFTAANGTTGAGLGDGSSINGSGDGGYIPSIQGNALELTNAANGGTTSTFMIPALANSSKGFTATFDVFLQDTQGGNRPADGFGFVYGSGLIAGSVFGEEGPGSANSLTWVLDSWDNTWGNDGGEARIKIGAVNAYNLPYKVLSDGETRNISVSLEWSPTNGASLSVDGVSLYTNVLIPSGNFTAGDDYMFGIGGRTGGATETLRIDNLRIVTVPEPTVALLAGLGGLGALMRRRR